MIRHIHFRTLTAYHSPSGSGCRGFTLPPVRGTGAHLDPSAKGLQLALGRRRVEEVVGLVHDGLSVCWSVSMCREQRESLLVAVNGRVPERLRVNDAQLVRELRHSFSSTAVGVRSSRAFERNYWFTHIGCVESRVDGDSGPRHASERMASFERDEKRRQSALVVSERKVCALSPLIPQE